MRVERWKRVGKGPFFDKGIIYYLGMVGAVTFL